MLYPLRTLTDFLALDVHGLRIEVRGGWGEVIEDLGLDFGWFRSDGTTAPDLVLHLEHDDTVTSSVSAIGDQVTVRGRDRRRVWEAGYLLLRRRVLAHVERRGLPPLHALGLAGPVGCLALILPSGGGKSTLAVRAVRDAEIRLLSDDSPLLDRHGRLHAFPTPIGIVLGAEAASDARRVDVSGRPPKVAMETAEFADRIQAVPVVLTDLVVGVRGAEPRLEPMGRFDAAAALLRHAFMGTGVGGAMQFARGNGAAAFGGKVRRVALRAVRLAPVLRRSRTWRLTLGPDTDRNWEVLRTLLVPGAS